ncbi:MAG: cytosine permease [Cyanobacteria bacterium SZAS LIN-5]|nr:cytosine permease [Cyanobacteria bacterium SZAS LIN-5]
MLLAKHSPDDEAAPQHDDHSHEVVPLHERRGAGTMGLLWVTMVTAFPSVLIGFQWFKEGLTLSQVLICTALSCAILLAYSIPAAYLGAVSGQTYGLLSRQVFGRWGSRLVSCNLLWIFIAWYGLTALLLADGLTGLFHLNVPVMFLAAALAVAMAFNNFFGFSGVANFARYLAAPLLLCMVGYTFFKVAPTCPTTALNAVSQVPIMTALTSVSGYVVGFAVWGNEPDYWRYGKPNKWLAALPLTIALAIGQIVFPVTGWMISRLSGITEYGAATSYMNSYAFGGIAAVAAIVLSVAYCASNDSNLYGMINAIENLKKLSHHKVCAALALICASFAAWLSTAGIAKSLESIASLNCVFLPTVTVIMIAEFFVVKKLLGQENDFSAVPELSSLPSIKIPAFAALVIGCTVGVLTSGVIPGLDSLHVGVCSIQAWLAAAFSYIPLRLIEHRRSISQAKVYFEELLSEQINPEPARELLTDSIRRNPHGRIHTADR